MAKRRESLIPLSREHHFALIICLRIHRGVPKHSEDLEWLRRQADKTIQFFEGSLIPHFQTEETDLFPAMKDFRDVQVLISELVNEHDEIRAGVKRLHALIADVDHKNLAEALTGFADLLERHIRKEERQLFPLYEQQVSPDVDARVGELIFQRAGTAMQPKDPRLLI